MKGCKGLKIPGLGAPTKDDYAAMELSVSPEEHEMVRRVVGKLQFLANERDDLLYPTKEVAKDLASPNQYTVRKMKKLVRYLQGTREVVHVVSMEAQRTVHPFAVTVGGGALLGGWDPERRLLLSGNRDGFCRVLRVARGGACDVDGAK